jgi:hypothetical protein
VSRLAAVLAVAACALSVAACGSGPAGFHTKALEICARYSAKEKALPASAQDRETAPLLRAELRQLRRLKPPARTAGTYRRWLASIAVLIRGLERVDVIVARDQARVEAALKRVDDKPARKLTPEELKHPTEAILSQTLEPLPEWHAFVRDTNAILRQSTVDGRRVLLLGLKLGLARCLD